MAAPGTRWLQTATQLGKISAGWVLLRCCCWVLLCIQRHVVVENLRGPNTLLAALTLKRQGVSVPLRPGEDACKRRGLMPRTASNRRRKRLPRRRKIRYINSQLPCDSEMNSTAGYIAICAPDAARLAPRNSPSATNHSGLGLGALLCPAF